MKKLVNKIFSIQLIKYGLVGATATGTDFLILYFLVEYVHLYYLAAAVISIAIVFIASYSANKYWTFSNRENHYWRQMGQYLLAHLLGIGLSLTILHSLVEFGGLWFIFAKVFATAVAAITNFLLVKLWVFNNNNIKFFDLPKTKN